MPSRHVWWLTLITGYTLEPGGPDSTTEGSNRRVSAGTYTFSMHNVTGRSAILIHRGSYPRDTRGCILIGKTKGVGYIGMSDNAVKELVAHLNSNGFFGKVAITNAIP